MTLESFIDHLRSRIPGAEVHFQYGGRDFEPTGRVVYTVGASPNIVEIELGPPGCGQYHRAERRERKMNWFWRLVCFWRWFG